MRIVPVTRTILFIFTAREIYIPYCEKLMKRRQNYVWNDAHCDVDRYGSCSTGLT